VVVVGGCSFPLGGSSDCLISRLVITFDPLR